MHEVIENIKENLTVSFCKAWNNLDVSHIENCLTDDFVYSSQMVLANINGKEAYLNYIKAKLKSFKKGVNTITAELGYYENEPCFVLRLTFANPIRAPYGNPKYKTESLNQPLVSEVFSTVLIKFETDLIKSAVMCEIPGISYITRTGVFPK